MRAVLTWGPVSMDLDINSVEYNKATKAICHTYYGYFPCPGSKWMIDNLGVSLFMLIVRVKKNIYSQGFL